nr:hypothetical protein [Tanacetum cinerariifolium]
MGGARERAYAIDGGIRYSVVSSRMNQLHQFKCTRVGGSGDDGDEVDMVVEVVRRQWRWGRTCVSGVVFASAAGNLAEKFI